MIDSATQNHRRFIELYGQDHLEFPPYNQEHWVEIQHYQSRLWDELVLFWKIYNLHLEHLLDAISEPEVLRLRHPHNLDRFTTPIASTEAEVRLTDLVGHYLDHIKLHLKQIRAAKLIWKRLLAPKGCARSLRLPANCFFLHTLKANR